jgi:hypothetical protein
VGLYDQYPLLKRVKNVFNSVQNTEESTGNAQYKILQTAQRPGIMGRRGPFMNKFNWGVLINDPRLTAAQKKTVNKILMSLQVPARDKFRNRPRLNFNISGMSAAQVNAEVLKRLPKTRVYNNPVFNNNLNQGFKKYNNPVAATKPISTYGVW